MPIKKKMRALLAAISYRVIAFPAIGVAISALHGFGDEW